MNQINLCEKYLVDLSNNNSSNSSKDIKNVENKEDNKDFIIKIVNKNTKNRKIVSEDYEELLNNYIVENEKHQEEKHKLISYLFRNIL